MIMRHTIGGAVVKIFYYNFLNFGHFRNNSHGIINFVFITD